MSIFAAVRSAARVGPARLVGGMRVNAASSLTRSARLVAAPVNATRAFSVSSARFGSGSCAYFLLFFLYSRTCRVALDGHESIEDGVDKPIAQVRSRRKGMC